MNPNTGEIKDLEENEPVPEGWVSLTIGEVVEVKGVKCRLAHVNSGKRRLSLVVLGNVPMPKAEDRDPIRMPERKKSFAQKVKESR